MDFVKVFSAYSRTHLYFGFEVVYMLITMYIVNDCPDCNYALLTWSSWLLGFVLIMAPLWFNPFR